MKWLLILLLCIMGLCSNSYSQDKDKEVYYGIWEGTSQFITINVEFEDSSRVVVRFYLPNNRQYIERRGVWRVQDKMAELLLNYEETNDYSMQIKNVDKWYEHKLTITGKNIAILIDDNASIYTVNKIFDKKGKRIKRSKKRI